MPSRVVIGLIDYASFTGQRDKNPFAFEPFNVTSCSLHIGGEVIPHDKSTMEEWDFADKESYTTAYMRMLDGLQCDPSMSIDHIDYDSFGLFQVSCSVFHIYTANSLFFFSAGSYLICQHIRLSSENQ